MSYHRRLLIRDWTEVRITCKTHPKYVSRFRANPSSIWIWNGIHRRNDFRFNQNWMLCQSSEACVFMNIICGWIRDS